jgi:Replication-relaxation
MRAWTALPERDQTLLRWLVVGSAVTAELAALLVYGAPRTARRRLHRLVEEGLLRGYWTANRQRPRGRYAYSLLGPVRAELERRRGKAIAPSARLPITPTIHQLATHDLLAAFLRAADPTSGRGLLGWLPERAAGDLFDGYLRPDALASINTGAGRLTLFVERDLGTETLRVLIDKVSRYRRLFRHQIDEPVTLGVVVDSPRRAASLRRGLSETATLQPTVWIALADDLIRDPLGCDWLGLDGERRRTLALAAGPPTEARLLGPLCLLDPDASEAFEEPAELLRARRGTSTV